MLIDARSPTFSMTHIDRKLIGTKTIMYIAAKELIKKSGSLEGLKLSKTVSYMEANVSHPTEFIIAAREYRARIRNLAGCFWAKNSMLRTTSGLSKS